MTQFLSIMFFAATLMVSLAVIAAMLGSHAEAILHALTGHSLKAAALERRTLPVAGLLVLQDRRARRPALTPRCAPLRAAA